MYTMGRSMTIIFHAPAGSRWVVGALCSTDRRIPAMGPPTISGTRVQSGNVMPIFFPTVLQLRGRSCRPDLEHAIVLHPIVRVGFLPHQS